MRSLGAVVEALAEEIGRPRGKDRLVGRGLGLGEPRAPPTQDRSWYERDPWGFDRRQDWLDSVRVAS